MSVVLSAEPGSLGALVHGDGPGACVAEDQERAAAVSAHEAPEKPRMGTPCNGCGMCCRMEVCGIGVMAYGDDVRAPCPGLRWTGQNYRCSIVEMEAVLPLEKVFASALGIGKGCCASDDAPLFTDAG
jgi:hypothetical protein